MASVSITQFRNRAGHYLDQSGKEPVFITRYGRPASVLLTIEDYDRLKARDSRRALYVHELSDEWVQAMTTTDVSHIDPALDRLLD